MPCGLQVSPMELCNSYFPYYETTTLGESGKHAPKPREGSAPILKRSPLTLPSAPPWVRLAATRGPALTVSALPLTWRRRPAPPTPPPPCPLRPPRLPVTTILSHPYAEDPNVAVEPIAATPPTSSTMPADGSPAAEAAADSTGAPADASVGKEMTDDKGTVNELFHRESTGLYRVSLSDFTSAAFFPLNFLFL